MYFKTSRQVAKLEDRLSNLLGTKQKHDYDHILLDDAGRNRK